DPPEDDEVRPLGAHGLFQVERVRDVVFIRIVATVGGGHGVQVFGQVDHLGQGGGGLATGMVGIGVVADVDQPPAHEAEEDDLHEIRQYASHRQAPGPRVGGLVFQP